MPTLLCLRSTCRSPPQARIDKAATGDLADVLKRWQPWLPPKQEQVPRPAACVCGNGHGRVSVCTCIGAQYTAGRVWVAACGPPCASRPARGGPHPTPPASLATPCILRCASMCLGPPVAPLAAQAFNQGGLFFFEGPTSVISHYDKSTGAHADLQVTRSDYK